MNPGVNYTGVQNWTTYSDLLKMEQNLTSYNSQEKNSNKMIH